MRDLVLKVSFKEEFGELLDHPDCVCLVLPLTETEIAHLSMAVNAIGDNLGFNLKNLQTLRELAETKPEEIKHIRDILDRMLKPAEAANEIFDHVRVLLGRAMRSTTGKRKGKLQ